MPSPYPQSRILDQAGRARPSELDKVADQLSKIAAELRANGRQDPKGNEARAVSALVDGSSRVSIVTSKANQSEQIHSAPPEFVELARGFYALRRKRAVIFGNADLFGEPAWDILLDLYIAEADGKDVSVSSACIGSASPPTTGLRWLGILCEQGLVVREHDPNDQRRVLVRLTHSGITAMNKYFAASIDHRSKL